MDENKYSVEALASKREQAIMIAAQSGSNNKTIVEDAKKIYEFLIGYLPPSTTG